MLSFKNVALSEILHLTKKVESKTNSNNNNNNNNNGSSKPPNIMVSQLITPIIEKSNSIDSFHD